MTSNCLRNASLPPRFTDSESEALMDDLPAGVKEDVLKILSDYLTVPPGGLQPNQSLEELGADSLDFIEIVFEIEEKLGIKADEDLAQLRKRMHTIGDVLQLVS